ncbi:MAG: branched-chain amino acid ABC transporter permease [Xanthobacteraceae bacterium]
MTTPSSDDTTAFARARHAAVWFTFVLILIVAPLIFSDGASLSILCQMGTAIIFALSYNMLLGQGGMLSFGHAVYSGLGAYITAHAINIATANAFSIPLPLFPLVGGLAGVGFGILFGYVTTKKSGVPFAMITLGIVELVFAGSLMLPGFFGGEGGISINRVFGGPLLGITYGPQIEVYYLIAAWLLLSTIGMYAFTRTPLGYIVNAVRDNPERAEFIGYNARMVRYLVLIISTFFAGVSGGLTAITFEIVTSENVSAARSGAVLLFTFIGGIGHFFGPIIGAIVGVLMTGVLSDFSKAWLLYLGIFFITMVLFAPGGISGIAMLNVELMKSRRLGRVWLPLIPLLAGGALVLAGFVAAIEMLYERSFGSGGTETSLAGFIFDFTSVSSWLIVAAFLASGGSLFAARLKPFAAVWDQVSAEMKNDRSGTT